MAGVEEVVVDMTGMVDMTGVVDMTEVVNMENDIRKERKVSITTTPVKLRRIFDPQGIIMFPIRLLTPQQATGDALATGFNFPAESFNLRS